MRIKTLVSICRREGGFKLWDRTDDRGEIIEQWLGTVGAAFPLSGVPVLNEENLIALFDITEQQRKKMLIRRSALPTRLNFNHSDSDEIMLDREIVTLNYNGRIIRPLITSSGVEFINNDYLSPLSDVADMLDLYERRTTDGGVYIAAKTGFMIAGVIMPMSIIEETLVDNIGTLANKCRIALEVKIERKRRHEEARGKQMTWDDVEVL